MDDAPILALVDVAFPTEHNAVGQVRYSEIYPMFPVELAVVSPSDIVLVLGAADVPSRRTSSMNERDDVHLTVHKGRDWFRHYAVDNAALDLRIFETYRQTFFSDALMDDHPTEFNVSNDDVYLFLKQ